MQKYKTARYHQFFHGLRGHLRGLVIAGFALVISTTTGLGHLWSL